MQRWLSFVSTREIEMKQFDYWHKVPIDNGFRYLAAILNDEPEVWELQSWLKNEFPYTHKVEISDEESQSFRIGCFMQDRLCAEVVVAPSLQALPPTTWLGKNLGAVLSPDSWQIVGGDEDT
tara:strand:+ start:951 stop:1316 length:366 start_codon:yes stop_codon:yes gene_type:complete